MSSATNYDARERAPLLLVFGNLAERVAALLRAQPSLVARLAFAPREAIHAIAAFLYLAPESTKSDAEIADLIDRSDPRDLLRKAIPESPIRLYRAFDKAGNVVRARSFYERVAAICRGPFGTTFLEGGDLNDRRLDHYETMQTMDPLTVSLHSAMPENLYLANAVDTLVVLLRSHGAIGECDFPLPKSAGVGAVQRRILKAIDAVRAPIPAFVVPSPFHYIETIGELRRIGREFENCIARLHHSTAAHLFALAAGSTIFLTTNDPSLLIALRTVGRHLWYVEQMAGPKNAQPTPDVRQSIERSLKNAGLKLVSLDPTYALAELHRSAGRPKNVPDADLDGFDLD
jgi:hypothetical protein